jgi:hypothetical protein
MVCSGRVELPRPRGHCVLSAACLPSSITSTRFAWSTGESNPRSAGLQSEPVHPARTPRESQRGGSNSLRALTRRAHHPSCCAGMEPTPRLELGSPVYKTGAQPVVLRRRAVRGGNRTRTPRRAPAPQAGASTCSATRTCVAGSGGFEPPPSEFRARSPAELDELPKAAGARGGRRPHRQRASDAHDGVAGSIRDRMPASAGVRSPLRWLQPSQAATVLSQVFRPPRERGRTWSTVVACPPQ